MKILLGSKSPRRIFLLNDAGFTVEPVSIDCDENFDSALKAEQIPVYLAGKKNKAYEKAIGSGEILVTADTVVWLNDTVYNKPVDAEDSFRMLRELSGKTHRVYTGVCIRSLQETRTFFDETDVTFYELSDEEIHEYIERCQPFDKAGSYGIQDWFGYRGVKGINGCFYNVMGFPVAKFVKELSTFNI